MQPVWENISDAIFDHAQRRPNAVALIEGRDTVSREEFATLVGKTATLLAELGIGAGDRVGIALTNSTDHIILAFAVMRVGATLAEMSVENSASDLAGTATKYGIRWIFVEADASPVPGITSIRVDLAWRDAVNQRSGDHRCPLVGTALQVITLTSGSTGVPKGVVTSHRQLIERFRASHDLFGESEFFSEARPGNFLLVSSIRFAAFFRRLLAQVFVGGPVILLPEFARPIELVRTIAQWDDAVCFVTANMCRLFIEAAPKQRILFPAMRALIAGGLPLYAGEKRALIQRVTPNFHESYGASGFGTIARLHPHEVMAKAASVGRPTATTEVEIVDLGGRPLPVGMVGRLRCRGPAMSLGYTPEDGVVAGAEGFADGWYYPGEIAALDDDGYLYLKGRVADLIRRRDADIFPPEVEEVLSEFPGVKEAAVVGRSSAAMPDMEVIGFIVPDGSPRPEEWRQLCLDRFPGRSRPDHLYFINVIPRLGNGKIDREKLRDLARARMDQRPG